MPAPKPSITRAEFDVLAARTGLPLDEAQKSECYAVFGYLEEIAARVRADGRDAPPGSCRRARWRRWPRGTDARDRIWRPPWR